MNKRYAELADGTRLEFPEGTSDEVIAQTAKRVTAERTAANAPGIPEPILPQTEHPLKELAVNEGPRLVGATAGAIAGGLSPPGNIPGAVAGAMLGGAGGEAYTQLLKRVQGKPDIPQDELVALTRILKAGGTEGAFELVGGVLMKSAMKTLAPFANKVKPEAAAMIEHFRDKLRPVFTPAEATDSRILDWMQNVAENSILGSDSFAAFKLKRAKVFDDIADGFISSFASQSSPEQIGELFVDVVNRRTKLVGLGANVLYNNAKELIGDVAIPTKVMKKFVEPFKEVADELGGLASVSAGDDLVEVITNLPETLSYDAAKALRTRLLSTIDEVKVINKNAEAIGKAKKLISLIDNEMEQSLAARSPEALKAWRAANEFYRAGSERFNNTMIRRLVKMADESGRGAEFIVPSVFAPKKITTVRRVKSALREKDWPVMQRFFVENLISQAKNAIGELQGRDLIQSITNAGDDVVKEVLSPAQIKDLKTLANALEMTQSQQGEGLGKVWIQLTQAGAAAGLMSQGFDRTAGAILFGPALLAQVMLDPRGVKLLQEGIKLPANSPAVGGFVARLARLSTEIATDKEKGKRFSDTGAAL